MAQNRPFQILVIDDDLRFTSKPLFEDLVELYGQENVIWKETPQEGLDYLNEDNLTKRTIVILDYFFGDSNRYNGLDWFRPLQKKSALIYIILNTAHSVDEIPQEQLKECINNHLMAFVDKAGDGWEKTLEAVKKAIGYLNNRVDCILEEWILRHERFTREKPYMRNAKGEPISLNDILSEIRRDTDFGREMSSNIIRTAITLMQRDIDKLDNIKP
jgi:hypothetical protein